MWSKKFSVNKVAFYMFWTILLVGKGLGYSARDPIFKSMTWGAILFAAFKLIITKWDKKSLFMVLILNLLGVIIFMKSKDAGPLLTIITITAAKDIDIRQLLKYSLWVKASLFVGRSSLAIIGVIDNQMSQFFDSSYERIRYGLGFGQPNATHYNLFIIFALFVIVYGKKMKLLHYIMLTMYNFFIFRYTDSKTGMLLSSIMLITSYLIVKNEGRVLDRLLKLGTNKIYIILGVVSFIICWLFKEYSLFSNYGTLSSRFLTSSQIMSKHSLSLFGASGIDTDFGYIEILYAYGVPLFVIFLLINTALLNLLRTNKLYVETGVMLCYSIYTLSESYTMSILMNITLIFISFILYPKNKEQYLEHIAEEGKGNKEHEKCIIYNESSGAI